MLTKFYTQLKTIHLFLLLFIFSQQILAKDWSQLYLRAQPLIPYIYSEGGLCSGALIDKNKVLTSWHCVATLNRVFVQWPSEDGTFMEAQVIVKNSEGDIAILKIPSLNSMSEYLPIADQDYKLIPGQEVATIGHPLGIKAGFFRKELLPERTHSLSAGVISKVNEDNFVTDLSMSPGNSGGPVFNSDGKIVGVASRKLIGMGAGQVGYASSLNKIHESLKNSQEGQPLHWTNAAHRFEVNILYLLDETLEKFTLNSTEWAIELNAFLWSRLRLGYVASDHDRGGGVQAFKMGWNKSIQFSPLKNLSTLFTVGHKSYEFRDDFKNEIKYESTFWALGINLDGLRIEYEQQLKDEQDSTFVISLSFIDFFNL